MYHEDDDTAFISEEDAQSIHDMNRASQLELEAKLDKNPETHNSLTWMYNQLDRINETIAIYASMQDTGCLDDEDYGRSMQLVVDRQDLKHAIVQEEKVLAKLHKSSTHGKEQTNMPIVPVRAQVSVRPRLWSALMASQQLDDKYYTHIIVKQLSTSLELDTDHLTRVETLAIGSALFRIERMLASVSVESHDARVIYDGVEQTNYCLLFSIATESLKISAIIQKGYEL